MPTDKTDRNGDLHDGSTGRYKSKGEAHDSLEDYLHTTQRKNYTEINPQMILDYSNVTRQEWAKWYTAIGEIQRGMWCPIKILEFNSSDDADLFLERLYAK